MMGKVEEQYSRRVLMVGPVFRPPRGGIAQVLSTYDLELFDRMNFIANSSAGRFANLCLLAKSLFQCFWRLLTGGVRIVHIHTASRNSYTRSRLYQGLARLFGRKVIMHIHGGGFKKYYDQSETLRNSVSKSLQKADAVVVLSDEWKHTFERDLGLTNLYCIPNPIARPTVMPFNGDGRVHALFMGLFTEQKGIFDLIDAISLLDDQVRRKLVLHVCGSGDEDRLNSMVTHLGLNGVVIDEGWVSGAKKNELLSQCGIVILPSYVEAMPISILEGMSYGMAVLATNVGSIPSVVKDGVNGYLFTPGDKNVIADRLSALVDDSDLRAAYGRKSAEMVIDFFPESVANRLNELYGKMME